MGCGGSKVDDLPLVMRCKERRELIRRAVEHRYALANAHVAYFDSLKNIGEALHRFVDEDLVTLSSSRPSSPVLTLPSDRLKSKKKSVDSETDFNGKKQSSSISISHSDSGSHIHSTDDDDSGDHHLHYQKHHHHHKHDHDGDASHLHLSSDSDSDLSTSSGHIHLHKDDTENAEPSFSPLAHTDWGPYGMNQWPQANSGPYGFNPGFNPQFQPSWDAYSGYPNSYAYGGEPNSYGYGGDPSSFSHGGHFGSRSHVYYMKKSAPAVRTVIHEAEPSSSQRLEPLYPYSSNPYENAGFLGFPVSSPAPLRRDDRQQNPPAAPPPPPSPKVSSWDFFNPFDVFEYGYADYNSQNRYGYGSIGSSPDSNEVRQREGIPDLEEETEAEVFADIQKTKKAELKKSVGEEDNSEAAGSLKKSKGGTRSILPQPSPDKSRAVPSDKSIGNSQAKSSLNNEGALESVASGSGKDIRRSMALHGSSRGGSSHNNGDGSISWKEENSSPDSILSKSSADNNVKEKGFSFEVEEASHGDVESSKSSSLTAVSAIGTRDFKEVISEIKDEFEIASSYGKDVAVMLEVGKLPYHPGFLRVILSRILYLVAPSSSSLNAPSVRTVQFSSKTTKLATSYYVDGTGDNNKKPCNLLSTLEKLYAWEKKLYKEVKDEEKLRVNYEKQCKRLKVLDDRGAESHKIDATQASIRKLLTKLNVCIKAIDAISSRIHKLRDEELQPQVNELIQRLVQMWKAMLKCHQKQFQAIMESKTRFLKARGSFQRDSNLRATFELEMKLLAWCSHFNEWITFQRSYADSLNGWLMQCLEYVPEETTDGVVPFSPGRIGAPPIFVICHDWKQAMETTSEKMVADAMHHFASNLRQLWVKQDDEQRHRHKAEHLTKDFEKRLKTLWMEKGQMHKRQDAASNKSGTSVVASGSGVSPLDDLKVDLDSMKERLAEERARHKDAVKLVQEAVSNSLQGGLVPVFGALKNFTLETVKAHEQVRIQNPGEL